MSRVASLCDHLAPDCIARLERAAGQRFKEAVLLVEQKRGLAAIYWFGYCVEMFLTAAYFRTVGFSPTQSIDRDERQRRMAHARQRRLPSGEPLMSSDPHPLVGWARLLRYHRERTGSLSREESQRLQEAVMQAELVYKHWRPELRYKNIDVIGAQLNEVRRSVQWFQANLERL